MSSITPMRPVYQKGRKPEKVKALRNAARDQQCQLGIKGACRHDPAYTVGAHLRLFGVAGAAQKPDDILIVDACDRCHAILDSRDKWDEFSLSWEDVLRALMFTLLNRRAAGLVNLGKEQT
jgi:hypothetical protein